MSPDPLHEVEKRRLSAEDSYVTDAVNNFENEHNISYEGYEILPQDFNENNVDPNDIDPQEEVSSEEEHSSAINIGSSAFDQGMKIELTELWNSSYSERITDIFMDPVKEEQIRNAMAGFNLPSSSIPMWAKNIPEEQWKQQILNKINSSKKMPSDLKTKCYS